MARVLIIEDNRVNRELMTYLLTALGHDAQSAENGEEALRKLDEASFDLVACDIEVPRMDGYEILAAIRGRTEAQRVPVVAVTAQTMPGDREEILAAGFDGYISKPIDPRTFVAELETLVDARGNAART